MTTRKIGICNNPDESDDCGGYCIGRKCENCKYHEIIEIEEEDD